MAENDSSQEKTEEATSRKLQQAKDKGQVARSKELGTSAVLIAASVGLLMTGPNIAQAMHNIMSKLFTLSREEIFDTSQMTNVWGLVGTELAVPLMGFITFLALIAFAGNIALGGMSFSVKAFMPKASKMSPIAGFKRMFGVQALVELTKGIAKFSVVAITAYLLLSIYLDRILMLSQDHLPGNIYHALDLIVWIFILLCASTFLIVVIDVPFQIWNHAKQLKMTKQEVKDEYKDTEGKPEVKGRIRQLQREMAQRRMMGEVPNADVIVVNPEHYAVAVKYDAARSTAPFVVAKGVDEVAFKIREIAREHDVAIVSAPPLARAIYHTTKIDQEIPEGLFTAVAQVLAYVFQLRQFQKGKGRRPNPIPVKQPIPDDLKH
ncbi:flagellar biosynthesis protein FlhB [Shewanella schlegeliana]|uniref:Flagellar biosynthetic protein FlhB n=1 Tax=Shewanella schlegeliana TaxID=190308 RepID=A0ABS1SSS7_9GAMM|nr:flagellar biosynthesis protein FlhB [Shewanella schlegeliana]MBL4911596.1 flagellar biosynthesis protein FlhB [Shewanella schlegeliana]MCL1111720.1 flagellar biosynthesis protein FlhB [Shewanella schlegeliana]GIU36187.1 flagellar biosynthesis protein FlhB [Shewanella schlegeliana]